MNTSVPRFSLKSLFAATALALVGTSGFAHAVAISDTNLFSGKTTNSSDVYGPSFVSSNAVDGTLANTFVFADYDTSWYLSVSGFDSSIGTINIFNAPGYGPTRYAPDVTLYYSLTLTTSLDPSVYTAINGGAAYTLPYASVGTDGNTYTAITGLNIPTGAKSVLFSFGTAGNGAAIGEVQGYAVPEPATALLVSIGLAFIVIRLARARRLSA